ncbi:uncharacterized protein I303_108222 [Kwoniella dejecticola CBS 10117]|uniref:DNA repair protein RAD16 n=1 Tax=Kwoniella dejecticola CBS 10117 TaxID=1296121 RepID=A0A1A5ZY21_9TREE|nr:DNA repair protein RAD16 [Kwoniella dejecticola CBS 10117]OBR82688.1 DNA repair protein RAD16 [Kwoniella dejecticola CBS 10117]
MPPRRSARASLPTPAHSTTSSSTPGDKSVTKASNSVPRAGRSSIRTQPETPTSMEDEDSINIKFGEEISEDDGLVPYGVKKEESPESPFTSTSTSEPSSSKRYRLESITLPSRRSKLGLDKTESADNLTLDSPSINKRANGVKQETEDIEMKDEQEDTKTSTNFSKPRNAKGKGKSKVDPKEQAPFNIGKFSSVSKAQASDLALDAPAKRTRLPRASKGKAVKQEETPPLTDEESAYAEEDDDGGAYAMDSDEEEKQLKEAIKASTKKAKSSTNGSSTASTPAKGARKTRGNQAALRSAVARAAEKRLKGKNGITTPSTRGNTTNGDVTPRSVGSTGATDVTPLSDDDSGLSTALSEISDEEAQFTDSDMDSDDSEESLILSSRKKGSAKKGKFAGKGLTLDGRTYEEMADELGSEGEGLDPDEMREMTLRKMREKHRRDRKKAEEAAAPRKKKERELSKKLGRKLTNGERNLIALGMSHPELEDVWGDLQANVEPVKPVTMEAHPSLKLTLLPFQKESLYWMKKQEEGPWKGGMLADEMGMGKTIQTIALLLSEPRRKPSLVVAPVVALMQWKHEIETHAEGFTVCLWHGQGRMKANELKKYDVVLSSYGTLEAAFRRQQRGFKRGNNFIKEKSPMHEFEWYRVILDEAHNIKERSTNAAKAAFALHATYKWCLSGTPLQNRVGELYSLVRFLGADPFSHYFCKKCDCKSLHWQFKDKRTCDSCGHKPMDHVCFWNTEILTPIARYGIEEGGPGHTAFKKLKILLDRMMLRRTKLERADDLGLPPRTIVVRRDFFSPQEKELYMSLFTGAKRQFDTYVGQGTVLNNYSNIFSLITRMRQMACHPDLVLRGRTSNLVTNGGPEGTVCRLCNDTAEDAIMSQCHHVFDRECIRQYLEVKQSRGHRPECPVCHIEISIDLEAEALDLEDNSRKARQGILSRLDLQNWRSSSKLEALVEELEKLRNKDCTIKSLVFSQFVSFLDLIAFRLQRAGFNICRLEGGMTPQQRDATIQHFMNNTHVTVFLISLKAGGVALNLTEASMVFMMDSWWNPSVEYQAMDRIHRLGQKRPVKVVKLVVEDSIEDQIVQLQHKKLAMTEAALNKDPDAALGKLTVEDLGFLFKL